MPALQMCHEASEYFTKPLQDVLGESMPVSLTYPTFPDTHLLFSFVHPQRVRDVTVDHTVGTECGEWFSEAIGRA